jgi:D-aminoacyl-tRNA deacylase
MIALIQRVESARVEVDNAIVGAIGAGLLAFIGVEPGDGEAQCQRMAERLLGYRVFSDDEGRMNLPLSATGGGLLLVSQFTLAADTRKGMRPSFTTAAPPDEGRRWFDRLVALARAAHPPGVETGQFGAHMKVHLINDGPVTFRLEVR